jgi:glycosyltransferase involved in cell wall biosynthesis
MHGVEPARVRGSLGFTLSKTIGSWRRSIGEKPSDVWARENEAFGKAATNLEWGKADTVYAFNGCALEVFLAARKRGLCCVLDQTAAPWRYNTALLRREQDRWPGWEHHPADLDASGRMIEREEAEWALADTIVCGSRFVVDAIKAVGGPVEKSAVVIYPTPAAPLPAAPRARDERLRVLFAGTLQLRKGIQYFSQVAGELGGGRFAFRAIGPSSLTPQAEKSLRERVDWRGAVPRGSVWDHYQWADIFLLPTLSEGSANVCLEAVSSGLPVVTSQASGLATSDAGTILTTATDTAAIAATLEELASSRGERRRRSALPGRSIEDYGRDLASAITTPRGAVCEIPN